VLKQFTEMISTSHVIFIHLVGLTCAELEYNIAAHTHA